MFKPIAWLTRRKALRSICKIFGLIALIVALDILGVFTHIFELDFVRYFNYPLEDDVLRYAQWRQQKHSPNTATDQQIPSLNSVPAPINWYNYTFLYQRSCNMVEVRQPQLTIIVKSALRNTERRQAIRKTWGFEKRFSDVHLKRVFMLGISHDESLMAAISSEAQQNGDIVQADFLDTYYNNTIKTMMAMRWVVDHCSYSQYYLFVDDDYYVSMKNVLRFIAHPSVYPGYAITLNSMWEHKLKRAQQERLYAGYVVESRPLRYKFSKWYVSLTEYPFSKWPPYVTAGAFILSRAALFDLYYVSQYTQHFRFDDIYLGIVALKAHLMLTHCDYFYFYRPKYKGPESYKFVMVSHEFGDSNEMQRIWNECRSAGYA